MKQLTHFSADKLSISTAHPSGALGAQLLQNLRWVKFLPRNICQHCCLFSVPEAGFCSHASEWSALLVNARIQAIIMQTMILRQFAP